ncbi:hypothetical protein [Nocardia sp. NPDC050793]|uniref:hypothetical protein n=1 Tax=Nocardia sp. NPDC050793 TaxID=3155159 RepID=UPI0033EBFE14
MIQASPIFEPTGLLSSRGHVELIGHVMLGFIETLDRLVLSDLERFPPEPLRATVRALGRTLPGADTKPLSGKGSRAERR